MIFETEYVPWRDLIRLQVGVVSRLVSEIDVREDPATGVGPGAWDRLVVSLVGLQMPGHE